MLEVPQLLRASYLYLFQFFFKSLRYSRDHLVSSIPALADATVTALAACFPPARLTGAPKVRAMKSSTSSNHRAASTAP